jgi:two-component system sensor histidine kinase VanS
MERQQFSNVFAPLIEQLDGKSDEEAISISEDFHARNTSFEFYIQNEDGEVIYKTPGAVPPGNNNTSGKGDDNAYYFGGKDNNQYQMSEPLPNGVILFMSGTASGGTVYREFIQKMIIVLLLVFLVGGLTASAFAYRITRPIKKLALDTKRMSELEFVPPPVARKDELGQLAGDVYKMYEKIIVY